MRHLCAVSVFALLTGGAGQAMAAEAEAPKTDSAIEEVVVTATRRDTTLQEAALSVSALTGDQLEAQGLLSIGSAIQLVPGVSLTVAQPGSTEIIIRGVSTAVTTRTQTDTIVSSTTSVYLNQLPVTSTVQKTPDYRFIDLERVEVLRGPQGTLYGQSAMGGVVRYITRRPDSSRYSGSANSYLSSTDSGGENYGVDGHVNVPLNDKMALRFVGYGYDNSGFIDVVGTAQIKDANYEKTKGARAAFRWNVTDRVILDLTYLYHDVKVGNRQVISSTYTPTRLFANSGFPRDLKPVSTSRLEYQHANPAHETNNIYNGELLANFDGFDANLILGRKKTSAYSIFEAAEIVGSTESYSNNTTKANVKSDTAELRFVSNTQDAFFEWIVGAYYEDASGVIGTKTTTSGVPNPTFGLALGANALDSGRQISYEELAFYGEVSLNLTDQLRLTGGYRYSDVKNNYRWIFARGRLDGLIGRVRLLSVDQGTKETVSTYRANLEYKFTPDILFYANIASGYRPGGFNPGNPFAVPPKVDSDYASDKLWSYEAGLKTSWLERRLTANASVYSIDWNNIQLQTVELVAPFFSSIRNVGKAKIEGVDLELTFRVNDNLRLSASYAYTDARITGVNANGVFPAARKGESLPGTPKNAFSGSVDWTSEVAPNVILLAGATYRHIGDRAAILNRDFELPSYSILDLRAGVRIQDRVSLTAFADNISNKIATNTFARSALRSGQNWDVISINRPRTIGVRASVDF